MSRSRYVWVFRRNRKQWEAAVERGEKSTEFWYGFKSLPQELAGTYVEDEMQRWSRWLGFIDGWVAKRLGMGFALGAVFDHWQALRNAEVIVTTQDSGGLPVAWLKALGLLSAKIVYISQGLTDRIEQLDGREPWLRKQLKRAVAAVDILLVWGEGAITPLKKWLGSEAPQMDHVPFGVNTDFWHVASESHLRKGNILSVGSDPWRDYRTLFKAVPDQSLDILTKLPLNESDHSSIHRVEAETDTDLRALYQKCSMVVVPVADVAQPSGQSTVLQSLACGAPVVMTRTRGFWAEGILEDGVHCLMVPPEDPDALKRAVDRLQEDKELAERLGAAGRKVVEEKLSEKVMAAAIGQWMRQVGEA
ncbi:MAG: glycosyltransferase family 4 protein [Verrucomicrobiota bacterium]